MVIKKLFTVVFLRKEHEVLLGMKKRGFGCNKWHGFGGKIEPNETILEAAVRELKEESCVSVNPEDMKNVGHLECTFEDDPITMEVRVFTSKKFKGIPQETEEMKPKWFNIDEIPFHNMWLDDKYWYPYMLQDKLFCGKFHYQGYDKILNYDIQDLKSMEEFYSTYKS